MDRRTRRDDLETALSEAAHRPTRDSLALLLTQGDLTWGGLDDDQAVTEVDGLDLGRFEDLGPIGSGGMGEVRRVRDPMLGRTMALKVLRAPGAQPVTRFVEEARLSAQLQHPCLVPVHELGTLPDGRLYFTMKEVEGRTLTERIAEVHARAWEAGGWSPVDGWTLRRLVAVVQQVAEAIAYAHTRGVVHRDLKPDNVMLGPFGEVFVLDWGVARVLGVEVAQPVERSRGLDARLTQVGDVVGTPVYMAPEQARGDLEVVGPQSDVWGLGALLHEVLTGRPPLDGDVITVLGRLVGPDLVVDPQVHPAPGAVDDTLWSLCRDCLSTLPAGRPQGAGAVAASLEAWLSGETARRRARRMVARANGVVPEVSSLRAQARAMEREADAGLAGVAAWAPERERHPWWALHDEAGQLRVRAHLMDLEALQTLHAALALAPELPEAHAALATRHQVDYHQAEARGDDVAAAKAEALLRSHFASLPSHHPVARQVGRWLAAQGSLTLHTVPSGAEVSAAPFVEVHRRLEEGPTHRLGTTPLQRVVLPSGSWMLTVEAPGREPVRYPVRVDRGEVWHGVPPGAEVPQPVLLPKAVPEGMAYVPAGWFLSGAPGDGREPQRWLWCDAFAVDRHPVTMRAFCDFLTARAAQGFDVDPWIPRSPAGRYGNEGAPFVGVDEQGRYRVIPDEDGDLIADDWPALCIDWHSSRAYAVWRAERTGLPLRLLGELEWEKAARGVDGRALPWGSHPDASRCNSRDSRPTRPSPCSVEAFPGDVSVYGVRGCAGNVRDWTGDRFVAEGAPVDGDRVVPPDPSLVLAPDDLVTGRGGAWPSRYEMCALGRVNDRPDYRHPGVGFRLGCSWPPTEAT